MIQIAKYFFFLVAGIAAIWVAVNLHDETLSPEFDDFFHEDPVAAPQNGFVALNGILAPEGASPLSYGQQGGADTKDKLSFKGNMRFDCWIQHHKNSHSCTDKASLLKSLQDNRVLLKRYLDLRSYTRFVDSLAGWQNGGVLINLNELFLARLATLVSEGKPEAALNYWLNDVRYWQRVIADKQGMVGKSIIMVVYTRSLQFLPVIIDSNPALARSYARQLADVLNVPAFGRGGWDMAATMRAEYDVIKLVEQSMRHRTDFTAWLYEENATKNKFFEFAKDVVRLSQQPPDRFVEGRQALTDKYRNRPLLFRLFYNPVGNLALDGLFAGTSLLDAHLYGMAYRRMMHLYITAKAGGISPANMPNFVLHARKDLRNPITGRPFGWDEMTHSLYFDLPDKSAARQQIAY